VTLRLDHDAVQQIEAATAWWATNRPDAPGAIRAELDDTLARIEAHPTIGEVVRHTHLRGVRCRLVRRIRYHVYYRVVGDDIEVLAFWHASRGSGPPL
jgi:plasmid stabilization system protein ParE